MDCIRCGGCCEAIPCWWAQINYKITKENKIPCPDLKKNSDGTTICLRMYKDDRFRWEMKGTGCHNPEFRKPVVALAEEK